jgi:hypothetical protein
VDADDAVKQLFPDRQWFDLWSTGALARFLPKRGERGDPAPALEVHWLQEDGTRAIGLMMLQVEGFSEWHVRRQVLHDLGVKWATDGWQVLALVFATCAWTRAFTPEDLAVRAGRLVEDYDDKQEAMIVQGTTLDGRKAFAQSQILRDTTGRVRATRPWDIRHAGDLWHLDFSTLDVAWKAYLHTVMQLTGHQVEEQDLHC